MRELVKRFLDQDLSRRDFARGLSALGLSFAAVQSILNSVAAESDASAERSAGLKFKGTGAEVFAQTLQAAGIRYVFGTTATGMSPFFDALSVRPDMHFVLALAESQATSMAQGYELATGETAALFVPGVAVPSTLNNLYNAWKDRSAIAVFSDGPSTQFPGRNGFQEMDDWLAPLVTFTKWRWQVNRPQEIAEMTRRALKLAPMPPGGPVHIRFPQDILSASDVSETIYPQSLFNVSLDMEPDPHLIESAARWLLEARKPLICAGHEVTRAGATDALVTLAELLGVPFAQGYSVYGDVPFRHPLFAGFYGLGLPRGLGGTDLFLNVGAPMPDPSTFTAPVPRSARVIHARLEFQDIANTYPTDIAIAAGVKQTLSALTDAIKSTATAEQLAAIAGPRLAAARDAYAEEEQHRQDKAKNYWDASPMSWERVSQELENLLEPDAIIVDELDYRAPLRWLDFKPGRKTLIGPTTGYALGWGLGAAMGVQIARPNRQVVCLIGDGALLFGQIESLWTAARWDIPIIIVVFNNRSYDNERNRIQNLSPLMQKQDTRAQWRDMTCYLGHPNVDFVGLARSFDIHGEVAANPAQLTKALRRAAAVAREGRPYLIDALMMQLNRQGERVVETTYPRFSVAGLRHVSGHG